MLWEGPSRQGPRCLGAERPAPPSLGVAAQVSRSRPRLSVLDPRPFVCDPARAAALEPGISKGMAVTCGGSCGGIPARPPAPRDWLEGGGGC